MSAVDPTVLRERVERLSDRDAISALELVVYNRNDDVDEEVLEAEQQRLLQALQDPEARGQLEAVASERPGADDKGALARAALVYLAQADSESTAAVAHAIDHPAEVGTRDPFTLAVVGAVVLALRPTIDIERREDGRWRFSFRTRPLKDSTMATVIGKLLSAGQSQAPPGV